MKYFELDDEEKQILLDFEKENLKSVGNLSQKKRVYQKYASQTLAKTRNINIRLSEKALLKLKSKAASQGIPYQTLAASVIYRFANSSC